MTTTNGWPGKPGVPLNPDRDGWHWLSAMYYNDPIGPPVACFWEAKLERWPRLQDKPGNYPVSCGFCYLGPALSHDEVAALQKRVAELRRLVEIMIEEDPNDMAADAVTVLDVWRKEARAALGGKDE